MPFEWTVEKLRSKPSKEIQSLYSRASGRDDDEARKIVSMILENGLLVTDSGGLPWDHPDMLEIAEVCADPSAVDQAVGASEKGFPALAGMEHRLVAALGDRYGPNFTTNYAGVQIKEGMLDRGWIGTVQKPMPVGSVAKSATVFVKKAKV